MKHVAAIHQREPQIKSTQTGFPQQTELIREGRRFNVSHLNLSKQYLHAIIYYASEPFTNRPIEGTSLNGKFYS